MWANKCTARVPQARRGFGISIHTLNTSDADKQEPLQLQDINVSFVISSKDAQSDPLAFGSFQLAASARFPSTAGAHPTSATVGRGHHTNRLAHRWQWQTNASQLGLGGKQDTSQLAGGAKQDASRSGFRGKQNASQIGVGVKQDAGLPTSSKSVSLKVHAGKLQTADRDQAKSPAHQLSGKQESCMSTCT